MSLQALREQRAGIAKTLNDLIGKASWDDTADQPIYDKAMADLDAVDAKISRLLAANEAIVRQANQSLASDILDKRGKDGGDKALTAYAKWIKGGDRALNEDDWGHVRAAMSTTTPAEGGFTVPSEVARSVIEKLRAFGGMRAVADVLVTEGGGPLNYPTSDGTNEEGAIVAENQLSTDLDVSFGTVALNVFKFTSNVFAVPIELLQDSGVDIEALINTRTINRLGRITNRFFTNGTGAGQPHGIVTAAPVGFTAPTGTAQVTAVTYDSLVNLQHSIDPAYRERGNAGWMFNDNTLRDLRKIKDGTGRPIFVPGFEMTNPGGAPDKLLGAPIQINQHMQDMAASTRSILFGDFKGYIIRDVLNVQMFRFTDSAYTKKGQVGYQAWARTGGNLVDNGAVRAFVNAAA